jgi:hypothetical protein
VSGAAPGAAWQQPELVDTFLSERQQLLPMLDVEEALIGHLRELLEPGAMFVNMDFVAIAGPLAGLFDEQMVANAITAEHAHHGARSDEQVEQELLADGDDDQPDTIQEQLQWLADAGFAQPEVHFKWAEAAVLGGIRPLQ